MLEIRVLGQFDLRLNGSAVLLPSRPTQSLLAYLAMTAGTAHRREKLAGMLWPDAEENNARNSLRHALWRIRKAIEPDELAAPYLLTDDLAVTFNAGADYWLDVTQLTRHGDTLGDLVDSVSVYRGELLPGLYQDWVSLERERLEKVLGIVSHVLAPEGVQAIGLADRREPGALHFAGDIEVRVRPGICRVPQEPHLHVAVHVDRDRARHDLCDARIDLFRSETIRTKQHRATRSGDGRQEFPPGVV